jgi:hypothetical protein
MPCPEPARRHVVQFRHPGPPPALIAGVAGAFPRCYRIVSTPPSSRHEKDRHEHVPSVRTPVPRRLPLGLGHRRVPDRGRRRRGRSWTVDLGHVLRPPGRRAQRRHRRGRRRPLPPGPRGRRPHAGPRAPGLPALDRLAAHPAHRLRPGQRRWPRVLRRPGRPPGRRRHRPGRHAVPLGPPAGAGGRGRLGQPRDRDQVRRVRPDRRRGPGRQGHPVDHPQRAVVLRLPRLRLRRARPRPRGARRRAGRRAPPQPRARPGRPRDPRGARRRDPCRSR